MASKIQLGIRDLLSTHQAQILSIAEKHGASNVRVFGSVARGEANEDSDIDFLVDYDLEKITPWFPSGLLLDLEQLLNCKVDVATVDMLKDRIRDRVLLEAVAFLTSPQIWPEQCLCGQHPVIVKT
jgi:uncharacterized protein